MLNLSDVSEPIRYFFLQYLITYGEILPGRYGIVKTYYLRRWFKGAILEDVSKVPRPSYSPFLRGLGGLDNQRNAVVVIIIN